MPPDGCAPGQDEGSGPDEGVHFCRHCNDVIGFYEPIVLLADGEPPRLSARAAAPLAAGHVAFHRDCFRQSPTGPG